MNTSVFELYCRYRPLETLHVGGNGRIFGRKGSGGGGAETELPRKMGLQ